MEPSPPAPAGRHLILVAGSGRSGTSLFTGLVHRLGVHIPQPEVLANESNPKGFGEPRWAVDFHQQLLRSVDVTPEDARPQAWDLTAKVADRPRARKRLSTWLEQQLDGHDAVVVKDPRITWFLPLYREVGREIGVQPRVVTMLRHPAATIRSRQLAYGTDSSDVRRLVGWLNMMLYLEDRTRSEPRAVVSYDALLGDWREALTRAEGPLGVPLVTAASPAQLAAADELVDPSLRRATVDWDGLEVPSPLRELAEDTYRALGSVSGSTAEEQRARADLDLLRERYADCYRLAEAVARSSIAAARAAERRKVTSELSGSSPNGTGRAGSGRARSLRSLLGRARRALPGSVARRVTL